jgi:hypothetical protein
MKGRIILILAALAVPALLLAADLFTTYNVDRDEAKESLFYAVRGGLTGVPSQAAAFKKVPPGERAAVVRALGEFAKAYFASAEFRDRYAQVYEADAPRKPFNPAGTDSAMKKALKKQTAAMKAMQEQMENMPPEMQAQMKEAMAKMKEAEAGNAPEQKRDKARYDKELAEYNKAMADPNRLPKDPSVLLRRELRDFLAVTADINFDAKLTTGGYRKHFVDKTLEAKPEEWKMWFRAGREATTAAREFAAQWLKELK